MIEADWINILFFSCGLPSMIMLYRAAYVAKSLSNAFFGTAILSFLIGTAVGYFDQVDSALAREWGDLVGITLVLCGLFVKTRNSKPVFARFPLPMTMLPILGVFFYPLIINADVVKDLLTITYQGGAILVSILVITINHLMYKHRSILIVAYVIFLVAYVSYWFIDFAEVELIQTIGMILFSVGMLVAAFGFRKVSLSKLNNKSDL